MESAVREAIERCAEASKQGTLHFGQVVATLSGVGVESYHADYRTGVTTYYLPDGDTLDHAVPQLEVAIGMELDAEALRDAIRGAQRDEIRYPEFVKRTREAGCIGYIVWIAGRHVTYFGRRGETHVERFPD